MSNIQATFKTIDLKVSELVNWSKNPREISDGDYERLKRDLERYTMLHPLLVDGRDGKTVLGGNMRLKALKELGVEVVTCRVIDVVDDKHAILLALKDNEQFGSYIESELRALTLELPEAQDIKIALQTLNVGDIKDWSEVTNNGDDDEGSEDKLNDYLKSKEGSTILKIATTQPVADKILELAESYASTKGFDDLGVAILELIETR